MIILLIKIFIIAVKLVIIENFMNFKIVIAFIANMTLNAFIKVMIILIIVVIWPL